MGLGALTTLLVGLLSLREPLCPLMPRLPLCPEADAGARAESKAEAAPGPAGSSADDRARDDAARAAARATSPAAIDPSAAAFDRATSEQAADSEAKPDPPRRLTVRVRRDEVFIDGAAVRAGRKRCSTVAGACTLSISLPGRRGIRVEATTVEGGRSLSAAKQVSRRELLADEPRITLQLEPSAAVPRDVEAWVWKGRPGVIQRDDVMVQIVGGTEKEQCATRARGRCTLPAVDTNRPGALELQVTHGDWWGFSRRRFDELQTDPTMEIVMTRESDFDSEQDAASPPDVVPCLTQARVLDAMRGCLHRPGRHSISVLADPAQRARVRGAGPYEFCLVRALGTAPRKCRAMRLSDVTFVRPERAPASAPPRGGQASRD